MLGHISLKINQRLLLRWRRESRYARLLGYSGVLSHHRYSCGISMLALLVPLISVVKIKELMNAQQEFELPAKNPRKESNVISRLFFG